MPRKTNTRKTKSKSKNSSSMSKAQIEKIAIKAVSKKAETKMYSVENVSEAVASSVQGQIWHNLDDVAQGTDHENRIGDSIQPIGFQAKMFLTANTSNQVPAMVRCVIFDARQGEFASIGSNFITDTAQEPTTLTAGDRTDIIKSLNRRELGKVYYDKTFHIAPFTSAITNSLGNGRSTIYKNLFFKLRGKRTWSTDTSNESEFKNLRVLFIVRDSYNNPGTDQASIRVELFTRYYYKDY